MIRKTKESCWGRTKRSDWTGPESLNSTMVRYSYLLNITTYLTLSLTENTHREKQKQENTRRATTANTLKRERPRHNNAVMTITKDDNANESSDIVTVNAEPDATMVTAVAFEEKSNNNGGGGGVGQGNEPPIPEGHARFYCSKCRAVSFLRLCDNNCRVWECCAKDDRSSSLMMVQTSCNRA